MLQENLELFLSENLDDTDHAYQSHALRYALASPATFVHILLPSLLSTSNEITFDHTSNLDRDNARNIYSQFISHVHRTSDVSPLLYNLFRMLRIRKDGLIKFKGRIAHCKAWNTIFIHRVRLPTATDTAVGKIVVIDSPDLKRFPAASYHHMKSEQSYIVDRKGEKPQVHIVVIDDLAPSDIEIRRILEEPIKGNIMSEEWCHNIVAYNLFDGRDIFKLRDFGCSVSENVHHRRQINRPGLGGAVGIGPRPDQAGNVGEYRNILSTNEGEKFALIDLTDEIFDYFMEVLIPSFTCD